METRPPKRTISTMEILAIVLTIVSVAGFITPFLLKNSETHRQTTCLSNLLQINTAVVMYTQDNAGRLPAHPWTRCLRPYLNNADGLFHCPSDPDHTPSICSYAYNGSLMRLDGTGINEAQLTTPVTCGLFCDATPSHPIGTDGYIPAAGLLPEKDHAAVPLARHQHGIVACFCDGHARWFPGDFNPADCANPVTAGFYACLAIGMVNNPAGGLSASAALPNAPFEFPSNYPTDVFDFGGEYCTSPLIWALLELLDFKANDDVFIKTWPGFLGENYTPRYPYLHKSFIWGSAQVGGDLAHGALSSTPGTDGKQYFLPEVGQVVNETGTAIAHDAVVCIVAKETKIAANPVGGLDTVANTSFPSNDWYVCNTATIAAWFTTNGGFSAQKWQAYSYSTATSTLYTCYHYLRIPVRTKTSNPTAQVITCYSDGDMVDRVAHDPYGIGYCSSAFVDYNRVQVLGMVDASCAGGQCYWPNADAKQRTCLPNPYPHGGPNAGRQAGNYRWPAPLMRTLCLYTRGDGNLLSLYADKLKRGPLFTCSYW